MPFRRQLTLWWALAFGLLLAVANLAIYSAFDAYLKRDLDRKVRTVAAAELASSSDGAGIHLHPLPKARSQKENSPTPSCKFSRSMAPCGWRHLRSGICRRWWDTTRCSPPWMAELRSCPLSSTDGPPGPPCYEQRSVASATR